MADRSRTSQRQRMAPGTLAVFKAAGHQFGAPASLWFVFSRFGARGRACDIKAKPQTSSTETLTSSPVSIYQKKSKSLKCSPSRTPTSLLPICPRLFLEQSLEIVFDELVWLPAFDEFVQHECIYGAERGGSHRPQTSTAERIKS